MKIQIQNLKIGDLFISPWQYLLLVIQRDEISFCVIFVDENGITKLNKWKKWTSSSDYTYYVVVDSQGNQKAPLPLVHEVELISRG